MQEKQVGFRGESKMSAYKNGNIDLPLMTVKEVSRLLQVSPRTLRQWAGEGVIGALRCGRQWRFRFTVVNQFLAKAETTTFISEKKSTAKDVR